MNYQFLKAFTVVIAIIVSALPSQANQDRTLNFECDTKGNLPLSIVEIAQGGKSEKRTFLTWLAEYFPDQTIAQESCQNVAQKLQNLYRQGELETISLAPAIVEGKPVVCIQGKIEDECEADMVLFSLENVKRPGSALRQMMPENLREKAPVIIRGDFPTKLDFGWLPFF
jgi:hypothetical protein